MLPSDPTDPDSIPDQPLPEDYGKCQHIDEETETSPSFLEEIAEIDEDEESESLCGGATVTEKPVKDSELYTSALPLGAGIAAKPCEKAYSFCFGSSVPQQRRLAYRNWITIAFKIWLKNMRNCIADCPSLEETNIYETNVCSLANLTVESIAGGTSYGQTSGPGKGIIKMGLQSNNYIVVHEIGHAMGLHHVSVDNVDDLYWAGALAQADPYNSISPIMSYGYMPYKNRPIRHHPICLHPSDSARICKIVAQNYLITTRKRVCGKAKPCCLEDADEKAIVGDATEGTTRTCYTIVKPKPGEELLEPTQTRCQADDAICMACKNKDNKQIPWTLEIVLETNTASEHYGKCYIGPYCPTLGKYYPGKVGSWFKPQYKDADGNPACKKPTT